MVLPIFPILFAHMRDLRRVILAALVEVSPNGLGSRAGNRLVEHLSARPAGFALRLAAHHI